MSLSVIHSYGATIINMPRGFRLVTRRSFMGLGIRRLVPPANPVTLREGDSLAAGSVGALSEKP